MKNVISRRAFLGGVAAAGTSMAALGLTACSPADSSSKEAEPVDSAATNEPEVVSYDPVSAMECDMVVVGGGNSGMSCAMEGAELGLSVVLLEKEVNLGGTLPGTEGMFGCGSQQQLDADIVLPQVHELVKEELVFTNYRTDPIMWTEVISHSGENIDWLASKGAVFSGADDYLGQSKYDTFHWWEGRTGASSAEALAKSVVAAGVNVMTEAPVVDLVVEDGSVVGVYADTADGIVKVRAGAVVLASGGIANDLELLSEKTGWDLSDAIPLYPINNTGDALRMVRAVKAKETAVSLMNVFKVGSIAPTEYLSVGTTMQPVCLFVNKEANRYVCEDLCMEKYFALPTNAMERQDGAFSLVSKDIIDVLENEGCMIGVASVATGQKLEGLGEQLDNAAGVDGAVFKGESIAELAKAMGVDADALEATVSNYNAMCKEGVDAQFGKDAKYLVALETGPFYAVAPSLCVFATMGGIEIDRVGHVLDEQGTPISGLYSSGTVSCILYKETYNYGVSGGMNAYCCYTGRNAARTVAAELQD